MTYCRINLSKTNYNLLDCAKVIVLKEENFDKLIKIYRDYCRYKQFTSVMPIFPSEVMDTDTEILRVSRIGRDCLTYPVLSLASDE
jgi:hypothetical protein